MLSVEKLFNFPILTRLRCISGLLAATFTCIFIPRLVLDIFPGERFYALELLAVIAMGTFALFGNKFRLTRENPNAAAFWMVLPTQMHLLMLTFERGISGMPLMGFSFIMIAYAVMFDSQFWRRLTLTLSPVALVAVSLTVEDPLTPPLALGITFGAAALLTHAISSSLYAARQTSFETMRLLEDSQSFAGIGAWQLNHQSGAITWTETAARLLDYSLDEIEHFNIADIIVGSPKENRTLKAFKKLMEDGTEYDLVDRARTKSGREIWLRTKARIIYQNGRPHRTVGVFLDITQQIAYEEELKAAKEQAEQAVAARSQFLANMSHEIRTPMNGVIGVASLLAQNNLDAQSQQFVEMIRNSGDALLHIINDILDFSKLDAGKMPLENIPFDLSQVANSAIDVIRLSAMRKGLSLTLNMPQDHPLNFLGDKNRIQQILINLLSNAEKFTAAGSISLDITITKSVFYTCSITFSVTDTGIGIAKDKQDQLFDAFTQEDASTTREFGGTGLGLAISSQLVRQMGGQLTVDSQKHQGASFTFSIALQLATQAITNAEIADVVEQELHEESGDKHDLRVLLAEDNAVNQKVAVMMLKKLGYSADVANNGREAVEANSAKAYDLIFMDLQMPEMDGLQATRAIRQNTDGPQPYIVALTANAMAEDKEQCMAAGMNDFVSKPMRLNDLEQALASLQHPP